MTDAGLLTWIKHSIMSGVTLVFGPVIGCIRYTRVRLWGMGLQRHLWLVQH